MKSLKEVRLSEIQEIWESFTGWYWFVTEYHEGTLAFGLVRGWEIEWGYFDLDELRALKNQAKVWRVSKENWAFCPGVINDAASYSRVSVRDGRRKAVMSDVSPGGPTIERRWKENGRRISKQ